MKLSSHLQRPQILTPLLDLDEDNEHDKHTQREREREKGLRRENF